MSPNEPKSTPDNLPPDQRTTSAEPFASFAGSASPTPTDSPRQVARSFSRWAVVVLAIVGLLVVALIAARPRPAEDEGTGRQPVDNVAPNVPADRKP